jgi:hypothetical protein
MSDAPSTKAYLRSGRLADILSLIQVLAYGEFAKRTHADLNTQLRRGPLTANTWTEIGQQHPELFRVLEAEKHHSNQETVALISRLVQLGNPAESKDEPPKSIPLTPDQTGKLMDLAIELHDREVQHRDRWKTVLTPMIVAIIAAAAAVTSAIISTSAKRIDQLQRSATQPPAEAVAKKPAAPNSTAETDARKSGARGLP